MASSERLVSSEKCYTINDQWEFTSEKYESRSKYQTADREEGAAVNKQQDLRCKQLYRDNVREIKILCPHPRRTIYDLKKMCTPIEIFMGGDEPAA